MNVSSVDLHKCTGCGACEQICTKKCIKMLESEEGFLFPTVDMEGCSQCGLCLRVCSAAKQISLNAPKILYAAACMDEQVLRYSSSGGIFYLLAKYVMERLDGFVCGAVFDADNLEVKHIVSDKMDDIIRMQGSKYVQSRLGNCYSEIKELLLAGKTVLFSGTPCQVSGLKNFLVKDYENLYLVDLICHGVPSPLLLKQHIAQIGLKQKITNISFRQRNPYNRSAYDLACFSGDKNIYLKKGEKDVYYNLFINNISLRESCYICQFAQESRIGDITIGDCANTTKYLKNMPPETVKSSVLINTGKGMDIWNLIYKGLFFEEADLGNEIKLNKRLHYSERRPESRNDIYKNISKYSVSLYKDFMKKATLKERIRQCIIRHTTVRFRQRLMSILKISGH